MAKTVISGVVRAEAELKLLEAPRIDGFSLSLATPSNDASRTCCTYKRGYPRTFPERTRLPDISL